MTEFPLVTVNILSFNRKDELRNTLTKVYEQDYKNIEVIVVDNASSDGSPEMVEQEFPDVILIKLDENIGIAGWNRGFEIAKGEYILVLDDDAYPEKNAIARAIEKLSNNYKIHCITFNIIDINRSNTFRTAWLPDISISKSKWPIFVGCAAMFDLRKIKKIFMPENYFIYQHELPVAADIYNNNGEIYYYKDIIAYHYFKDQDQYSELSDIYLLRNNLKFISSYLPFLISPFYFMQTLVFFLSRSIKKGWFSNYWRTIIETKFIDYRTQRINYRYFLELRRLKIFNQSVISKFI